jgi:hypothetical protein
VFRRAALAALAAPALVLHPAPAAAQEACAGQPIRAIRIHTAPVIAIEGRPLPSLVQSIVNGLSWQTRPDVVRRELRFAEGEPCDPVRLAESARVLRSYRYLRSAVITTTPAPGDSVDVDVLTRDEWALGGSIRISSRGYRPLKAVRITENNTFGRGMLTQFSYEYFGRHAGLVADVLDRQFLGGRSDAEVVAGKSSVGPVGELSWRRTFESEYDRVGWRLAVRYREEPFNFGSSVFGSVIQPLVSEGVEAALIGRLGRRGRQLIAGVALSAERLYITDDVLAADPSGDSAAAAALSGRFSERQRVAANLILGARSVRFVPRSGVDAVNAPDDIREGIELRTIIGHTFAAGGRRQEDLFVLGDLYAGGRIGAQTLLFLRARAEARRLSATRQWDGIIAAADLYAYRRLGDRAVAVVGAQGAGGWSMSTPFQLLVSSDRTMRGFGLASFAAGRRVVVQTEHRYFLGTVFGAVDVGTSAFVDAGRGWAGDAPFGEDTGTLVSAGGGLRLAFPSGSRFTTRLDLAFPLRGGHGAELRATIGRQFGITSPEAGDVERSRLPISQINLFNFQRY